MKGWLNGAGVMAMMSVTMSLSDLKEMSLRGS